MHSIKTWNWDKKARTMLRFIKPGNIFCFQYNNHSYYFGRIIAKTIVGHIAEVFDYTSSIPVITENNILNSSRLIELVVLDSYSLFDQKLEGDWRIIGYQDDFHPTDVEKVYFTYGVGKKRKLVDVYGNESEVDESEASKYPELSPQGDYYVKKLINMKQENQ